MRERERRTHPARAAGCEGHAEADGDGDEAGETGRDRGGHEATNKACTCTCASALWYLQK